MEKLVIDKRRYVERLVKKKIWIWDKTRYVERWKDQLVELSRPKDRCAKELFFPQVGEHWGNIGPELWRKHKRICTQGGRLSLYSSYSRENHSEIFHNSVFTLVESKTPPKRHIATSEKKSTFIKVFWPRVSRWSSPLTTTCWKAAMATGLPVSTKTSHLRFG